MTTVTRLALVRDHSGSMRSIARAAARDFNANIDSIREATIANGQETYISIVKCGHGSRGIAHVESVNQQVQTVQLLQENRYEADAGSTPLFDSVYAAIQTLKDSDDGNPEASFLVMATTDGAENSSVISASRLMEDITNLQKTDRWTFVFRVPKGGSRQLTRFGIPAGNIFEWDQTERGVEVAKQATQEAFTQYLGGRSAGLRSTTKFYANLEDVAIEDVKKELTDISSQVQFYPVTAKDDQALIRPFVEAKTGKPMTKGSCFYQLVKSEDKVQANKRLAIQDKVSGAVYSGDAARHMLALPSVGTVKLAPDQLGQYNVFIQSTSVNRKLNAGTNLMVWDGVGTNYKTGISAQ